MAKAKKKTQRLLDISQERADMISDLMEQFEDLISKHSTSLSDSIIRRFIDQLSTKDGKVILDADNLKKVSLIDKAWSEFQDQQGASIISSFITDLDTITNENLKYYRTLSDAQIRPGDIKNIINGRLGLDENGEPVKGGYMKGLMDDVTVRNEIKQFAYDKITTGSGFTDLTKGLKNLIVTSPESMGALTKFYRNFAFDAYATIDRLNGALYAEKLELQYFIFQGTRRKSSRYFCLQNKGKVFHIKEAEQWKELIGKTKTVDTKDGSKRVLIGPIVEDKATYNPLIDMGGFGCVDVASFISESIAFAMRPELKSMSFI